jgi:DNA-directed RNA polymerase specialized sigma24 family protein
MTPQGDGRFPSTHWTLIARIKSTDQAVVSKALDEICTQYHYPLYCYLRRRGCNHHDAQDVLHDFLARLLRHRALERVDEERGRLRGYLSTAISRHLLTWQQSAARRTEQASEGALSLDFKAIEDRYHQEKFSDADTPDLIFERKWATEMLHHVIEKLGETYQRKGKAPLFAVLRPVLESGGSLRGSDCFALATRAGLKEPALRTALSRMMQDFREALRDEVRLTVETPDEVPQELSYLMSLFQG